MTLGCLDEAQAIALYLYARGSVSLQARLKHTSWPKSSCIMDIAQDFSRHVERNKELSDCYDRARTALYGEPR